MADFYTILTNAGIAYETAAKAAGTPIKLARMSVGDGGGSVYNPDANATALKREVWRGDINALIQDKSNPSWLVAELVIPDSVGGWSVREAGIWTDTGILYAIIKYPESFKPILSTGAGKEFYVRSIFQTSNAANVTLLVDESIVKATRAWVIDYVAAELAKLDWKKSVRAIATAPITLSGAQTIDGVVLVAGDRVLVVGQAAAKDNGLYIVANGAWVRADDANLSIEVSPNLFVLVEEGTTYGDSAWQLVTNGAITLGTTALAFEMAFGRTGVAAGAYQKVTVDKYGRVIAGSNPTTLSGFGILDAFTKTETAKAVSDALSALIGNSPAALDAIYELAAALGNDPNFATTMATALGEKAPKDSPKLTGDPQVPTKATSDRSVSAANTKFVGDLLASLGLGTNDLTDLPTGIDLNTLNVGGTYQVNGAANPPPGGSTSGLLVVVGTNAQNYTHQMFFPQTINKMYHRCSYGVTNGVITWRDWEENPDLSTVKALLQASRRYFSGAVIGVSSARTLTAAQTGFVFNVTAAVAVKLPAAAAAGNGGTYTIRNVSSGNVTITLTSGEILVKAATASTLVLSPNEWVDMQASDANYVVAMRGKLGEVAETESPTFTGEVKIKGGNALRIINDAGQYGVIQRVDNGSYYVLFTDTGDASGNFNAMRPLQIELATGLVRLNNGAMVAAPGDDDNGSRVVNSAWVKKKTDAAAPPGKVAHFATTSPPAGWLKRNGAAYSRTTYAALFAVIGTKFGAGDGSTTFNVPDDRELVDRAWTDGLNALDAGRELFSAQAGQLELHTHTGTATSSGDHDHGLEGEDVGGTARVDTTGQATVADATGKGTVTGYGRTGRGGVHTHPLSINATGGNETRMANRAYLACIKY